MLKEESSSRARACDTCRSTSCTVYCHADSAYLCNSCDAQVHSANRVASRHKRVPVCESCERAPAAFLCEADDASLCTACDSEVHSANPLARRHHRVPISGNSYISTTHHQSETTMTDQENRENRALVVEREVRDEDERKAASWLFPKTNNNQNNNGFLFGDENLDFVDYNSSMDYKFTGQYNQHQQDCGVPQASYGGDRVVPLKVEEFQNHPRHEQRNFHDFDLTYGSSASHYNNYNGSLNHNAHMETSVVPESTEPVPQPRTPKGTIDQVPGPTQMISQLSPMDREARVLRYREKKKTRRFEKTIRYASRKAYAEKRPRINGRFAKRRDIEAEADQAYFNTMLMSDTRYGIVPSF